MIYYIGNIPISDELYHHQRLGAKWGQRNGPPYPLSRQQLTSAQLAKGGVSPSAREKYGDNGPKDVKFKERFKRVASSVDKTIDAAEKHVQNYKNRVEAKKLAKEASKTAEQTKLKDLEKTNEELLKKAEEREQIRDKESILLKGTPEQIYQIRDKLSNEEYQAVFTRLDNESKLRKIVETEQDNANKKAKDSLLDKKKNQKENIDSLLSKADTVVKFINKSGDLYKAMDSLFAIWKGSKDKQTKAWIASIISELDYNALSKNKRRFSTEDIKAFNSRAEAMFEFNYRREHGGKAPPKKGS
jgi:hypothetical protein